MQARLRIFVFSNFHILVLQAANTLQNKQHLNSSTVSEG